ncbi:MAG: hypothetical protein AAF927_03800 [Bacteroidota bacterium]
MKFKLLLAVCGLVLLPLLLTAQRLTHVPGIHFLEAQVANIPQAATPYRFQLKLGYGWYQTRKLSIQVGALCEEFRFAEESVVGLLDDAGDSLFTTTAQWRDYQALHLYATAHYSLYAYQEQLFLNLMGGIRGGVERISARVSGLPPSLRPSWGLVVGPEAELFLGSEFALLARLQGELLLQSALRFRWTPSLGFRFCFRP